MHHAWAMSLFQIINQKSVVIYNIDMIYTLTLTLTPHTSHLTPHPVTHTHTHTHTSHSHLTQLLTLTLTPHTHALLSHSALILIPHLDLHDMMQCHVNVNSICHVMYSCMYICIVHCTWHVHVMSCMSCTHMTYISHDIHLTWQVTYMSHTCHMYVWM